mmetsp:Transcript_23681/g.51241  ORF Transcript_23681/g.51241 Transcript_23681/m.51241 type:complete len:230 (-) Transcript_23681:742-1431(-)
MWIDRVSFSNSLRLTSALLGFFMTATCGSLKIPFSKFICIGGDVTGEMPTATVDANGDRTAAGDVGGGPIATDDSGCCCGCAVGKDARATLDLALACLLMAPLTASPIALSCALGERTLKSFSNVDVDCSLGLAIIAKALSGEVAAIFIFAFISVLTAMSCSNVPHELPLALAKILCIFGFVDGFRPIFSARALSAAASFSKVDTLIWESALSEPLTKSFNVLNTANPI